MSGVALLAGYVADLVAGDPPRWHPVAGFGTAAGALERATYAPTRTRGVLVSGALVIAAAAGAEALGRRSRHAALSAVTWAALGGRSLRREALHVADLIERDDLAGGRVALRALCGRDADALDCGGLSRAVVESVAENTSDAVVGALTWAAIGGPAGVAAYRAANTLDAMFGHRSERYAAFGWFPAKLDDTMNWPAARLSAAITCAAACVVAGSPATTFATVRRDGAAHPSPNAGIVEAAFAGALGVQLGGPLAYAAQVELRPRLGDGRPPEVGDIRRATRLSLVVSTAAALACAAVRMMVSAR